jgi:hypothetical protein
LPTRRNVTAPVRSRNNSTDTGSTRIAPKGRSRRLLRRPHYVEICGTVIPTAALSSGDPRT